MNGSGLRIALDVAAALLFVGALAYWWFDNPTHEVVGAGAGGCASGGGAGRR